VKQYLSLISLVLAGGLVVQAQSAAELPTPPKPLVAVPAFQNRTGEHVTRVVPGKYKEKNVKVGYDMKRETSEADGKRVETTSHRDVSEKQLERDIEFAPGEWKLPDGAAEIAADVVSQTLTDSGKFRVLNRATASLKQVDGERAFSVTSGEDLASQIKVYRECNAQYLVSGAISNFRVDERAAEAYGVQRRVVNTRVTLDLRVVDVTTGEIAYQASPKKVVTLQIPEGVTQITDIYDWESTLRSAIGESAKEMVPHMARGTGAVADAPEQVEIQVESTPVGADIIIDNDFVGNTPAKVKVAKGRHTLKIERQGYQGWEKSIMADAGMKIAPHLEPTVPVPKTDLQAK
jgi:curli biogenesis system outer membrane secretion channel CsgG